VTLNAQEFTSSFFNFNMRKPSAVIMLPLYVPSTIHFKFFNINFNLRKPSLVIMLPLYVPSRIHFTFFNVNFNLRTPSAVIMLPLYFPSTIHLQLFWLMSMDWAQKDCYPNIPVN
jgi:hypothetical protein